jgi:transposase
MAVTKPHASRLRISNDPLYQLLSCATARSPSQREEGRGPNGRPAQLRPAGARPTRVEENQKGQTPFLQRIAKGHRYLTVVADLERSHVLYLAEDRKQESLDGFWATLTPAQRDGIEAIAMDMWEPYIQSTRASLDDADAKIVFDKFHIAKHLHDAVDGVRRTEQRVLKQTGDARLTGTKYLWLMRPKDMTAEQQATFRTLQHSDLKVARAWALKERFRQFWDYAYRGAAQNFFTRWFWCATHSRLRPMAAVAKLIRRHLPNVLTYLQHGITNAGLEAVNATIQWVKKTARGFRNVEHFKTAIYFQCGGLDLSPTHTKA